MNTKIFLDSGDPDHTNELIKLLGSLDGQTTNPSLIAKNPESADRLIKGELFTREELLDFYKKVVKEASNRLPNGSISIEVYADNETKAEEMISQARDMYTWIPNAHIKLPTTKEGLKAAETLSKEGMRLNMTLCFSQEQAAAVYAATRGAKKGDIFVSPFVGRIDDRGENGMNLIKNIIKMYSEGDGHVEVLTASVRNIDHHLYALALQSDIITAPFKILKSWGELGKPKPDENFSYNHANLAPIPYQKLDLAADWRTFDIHHDLTEAGIKKFAEDWNKLIKNNK